MNSTTKSIRRGAISVALGATLLAALAGCGRRPIVIQAPPATVIQAAPTPVTVTTPAAAPSAPQVIMLKEAPRAPRPETMPPPPSSDYTWVPGYWAYRNGQQLWIAGHWEIPPRVGATWVPSRWERQGDGYAFIQGYWQ